MSRKSVKGVMLVGRVKVTFVNFGCVGRKGENLAPMEAKTRLVKVCTLNSRRGQRWHHTVSCGARPAVPRERCRGCSSAWAMRDCQGTPVRCLQCGN